MIKKNLFALLILVLVGFIAGCSEKDGNSSGVSDGIEAYLIKIDGKEIGYLSGKDEIEAFKELIKSEKIKEYEDHDAEIIKITINSQIEADKAICDAENLMSTDDILKFYEENGKSI